MKVWVAVSGLEVRVATTLKGVCEEIEGVSYSTLKSRREEGLFTVVVGKGVELRVWFFGHLEVRKVRGRGGKRKPGFKVIR